MKPFQIGVCTWSLAEPDLATTLRTVKDQLGLNLVQLGLFADSLLDKPSHAPIIETVSESGVEVSATFLGFIGEDYSTIQRIAETGGFVPDETFDERFNKIGRLADLTAELGASFLGAHVGFVPHDRSTSRYRTMVDRLRRVSDVLASRDVTLLMETGQERAEGLVHFIDDVGAPNVRVNFDPANMILYGVSRPVEAVEILGTRIAQTHMKDAKWSDSPGQQWGAEMPLGVGEAEIPRVVARLRSMGYAGPLIIEREGGADRIADIRSGIELLRSALG